LERLRFLYLDFNVQYINPTRNLIPYLFHSIGETVCFGPGYSDPAILSRGLDAFIEDHGPFDCVIATEHVIFYHLIDRDKLLKAYRRNYVCRFPIDLVLGQESIHRFFLNSTGLKLITLLESDFYNFDGSRIQAVY
jgi:hypothetical protein